MWFSFSCWVAWGYASTTSVLMAWRVLSKLPEYWMVHSFLVAATGPRGSCIASTTIRWKLFQVVVSVIRCATLAVCLPGLASPAVTIYFSFSKETCKLVRDILS